MPIGYTGATSNAIDEASRLRAELVQTSPTVQTRVLGEPAVWSNFQTVSKQQLARGEEIGFPLILLILLAAFGTVAAAVAPLALGFVAVFLTGAVIYGLSRSFEISVYVTNMASMIGIGVAVDYSLFIVSRFRSELREGASSEHALRRALASSGTAVVFSGATVAVALAGLFAIDVNGIRSMAVGAIVVVCISVLASATLLPALLAVVGGRVDRFRLRLPWRTGEEGGARFWTAWAHAVMRRPVVALVAGRRRHARGRLAALRDDDVQPRPRRAPAQLRGARRDRAGDGDRRARLQLARARRRRPARRRRSRRGSPRSRASSR